MTQKDFLYQLRRGLGSAIVELKTNPDYNKYRDIVLRCCLKDIGYDVQCEGTKGYYLYTAICALGVQDEFEPILVDAFMNRLELRLFQQLADILCLYADEGSEKSQQALREKYESLVERLSKQRVVPYRFCEREQLEHLMIYEVDTYKWTAFKKCIADAGRILMARRDDSCNCYDWFICHCENNFGKERVAQYFVKESAKSEEVKAFVTAINELEEVREENSRLRVEPKVTLKSYITRAKELENDQYAYARMRMAAMLFLRQANPDDMLELASIITNEQSDEVRANLLRVFRDIDFPSDIELLIKYAESGCERLQNISIDALERFSGQRVRDLATKFITEDNLDAGLPLLINNWHRQVEPLVRERILTSKKVSHSTQRNLRDIYSKHRSKSCGDILENVYRNGECTLCRFYIVEIMWKNRVLSDSVLEECLYDSYDDTRKLAMRIKSVLAK